MLDLDIGGKDREYFNSLLKNPSIDHDGVGAEVRVSITDEFNARHNTDHKATEVNRWDIVVYWSLAIGMSQKEAEAENNDLWYKPGALFKAKPVNGFIDFLKELEKRSSEYIINSSRIPQLHQSTVEWYKIYAPFVDESRIQTGMEGFDGIVTKINRINAVKRRLHIEDVPFQAKAVLDYTHAHVILLSNQEIQEGFRHPKLTQFKGVDGNLPDFRPINDLFFG